MSRGAESVLAGGRISMKSLSRFSVETSRALVSFPWPGLRTTVHEMSGSSTENEPRKISKIESCRLPLLAALVLDRCNHASKVNDAVPTIQRILKNFEPSATAKVVLGGCL